MWNLKSIPKILHLYWGRNKPLSFMRYMTYNSFKKLNKDWQVIVWIPDEISITENWITGEQKSNTYKLKDYIGLIDKKDLRVAMKITENKKLSEVQKSDIFRFKILYDIGGVWSDIDILYIKSINEININKEEYDNKPYYINIVEDCPVRERYVSVGFMMSPTNSIFSKNLYERSKEYAKDTEYQSAGRYAIEDYVLKNRSFINIDQPTVYPIPFNKINNIYQDEINLNHDTVGIHWFGGSKESSQYELIVNEEILSDYCNSTFFKKMKQIYEV